ncbi:hypothetical protein ACTJK3_21955 [Pseudomonas sp. 22105]|uniref:hypothetical protein n=1 Tax=Pseudomonas TaxID=286 RepID=UPI0016A5DC31|nr:MULTISPECIES: hypothetical protein [Pseudomonas]NKF26628.1 hypothetical protein [Pseudomonas sp. BG5]
MTRWQLSGCAIDSQVLIGITLSQCGRGRLAKRCSFDIIRADEFAAPKDFISLKPQARKLAKKRPGKKAGSKTVISLMRR